MDLERQIEIDSDLSRDGERGRGGAQGGRVGIKSQRQRQETGCSHHRCTFVARGQVFYGF